MNVGILCGKSLPEYQIKALMPILEDGDLTVRLAVVDARKPPSALRKIRKHLRRGRGGYVLVMGFNRLFGRRRAGADAGRFFEENNIKWIETNRPRSKEVADAVRDHDIDALVLIGGFGIIREPLISSCPKGILSYHHGDMRKYRGMPPGLWELYNAEREMGITVQRLAGGIDCGVPVIEKKIAIHPADTPGSLRGRAFEEGEDMMYGALKKIADPEYVPEGIGEYGRVYTLPNLRQWILLNARIAVRKIRAGRRAQ
jgi:folate-dependent phosphoribosylglycinamide formyltransferase PurN